MKFAKPILAPILAAALLAGCSDSASSNSGDGGDEVEKALAKMTLREKVGQMFFVRPESLDTTVRWTEYSELQELKLQAANETMLAVNDDYPVGGVILFAHNIDDAKQLAAFVAEIRALNGSPLLAVDEEGGRVARIANNGNFDVPKYESMTALAADGDPDEVTAAAYAIGSYVRKYGFDVDFAPVADVNTNPDNVVIGPRAFSDDPEVAATMAVAYLKGLDSAGVIGTLKHFPGHGDVRVDTHYGYAETLKSWDEMVRCEMVPFKAGIAAGARMVMTAHIAAPNVTGNADPSTLSPVVLRDKLRGELGFDGVIVADAMDMGAIVKQYASDVAAVKAIAAGVDVVLCPKNFVKDFDAVVAAVEKGDLEESRIDESVRRILKLKSGIPRTNP